MVEELDEMDDSFVKIWRVGAESMGEIELLFHGCEIGFMAVVFLDEPGSPVLNFLYLIMLPFSVRIQGRKSIFSKCGQMRGVYA